MSHTPGPWEVGGESHQFRDDAIKIDSPTWAIGLVWNDIDELKRGEGDANARLIAAAPELLDYLVSYSQELMCICKFTEWTGQGCHKCEVDRLIAKATGGAQ